MNRKWLVLIAIGTGTFMSALDGSVANMILPIVRDVFRSDVATVEWVVSIYLLTLSGLLLSFGRLGDLRGHKAVYLWGFAAFIAGSALCGAAWSPLSLILFRAMQAVGGAMLASNSPAIVTGSFEAERRGRAFGLVSAMTYLGLTVGPSLGGWLTQTFSWRAVFYINVPVGLLALGLSYFFIPNDSPAESEKRFDFPGAALFLAGLTALLLGLNKGAEWGWTSPATAGLLVAAFFLLALFLRVESRSPAPMLDLSLFRVPLFSASFACAVLNYVSLYSLIFLTPFYLIQGRGLNPAAAGALLTAQPIAMAIAAPLSGLISDKVGSRLPGMIGMAILAGGLFLLSAVDESAALWQMGMYLAIAGLGTGAFISPNTSALMSSAPKARQGIASGVLATARSFGMSLGIGLAGAVFSTYLARGAFYRGIGMGFFAAGCVAVLAAFLSATKSGQA